MGPHNWTEELHVHGSESSEGISSTRRAAAKPRHIIFEPEEITPVQAGHTDIWTHTNLGLCPC